MATSIGVDYSGNVYVAGVSGVLSGLHASTKFAVVKFNQADGATPWPISDNGSHANYHFDTGALILDNGARINGSLASASSDTEIDTENWRCAIAVEDVPDVQPQIAITGPSSAGAGAWTTAVLDYQATDGIEVKPGWPVLDFTGGVANSVAMQPTKDDDFVYVTGSAPHVSLGGNPIFTTVKYSGAGVKKWTDQWLDHGKGGEGYCVVADKHRDGTVYATGYVQTSPSGSEGAEPRAYATLEIDTDPDTGGNVDAWDTIHDGYSNGVLYGYAGLRSAGTSIDLTYECTGNPQKPIASYVYVTGLAEVLQGSSWDIASLRYNSGTGGGSLQWSQADRYAAAIGPNTTAPYTQRYYFPSVLGAGNGNFYVIGSQYAGTKYNYVFMGRTKADAARFTTGFTANGNDLGHALTTGGAGLMYFTGQTKISSADLDFATGTNAEGLSNNPNTWLSSMNLWVGTSSNPTPDTDWVKRDDSEEWVIQASPFSATYGVQAAFSGAVPTTSTEISITTKGHPDHGGSYEEIRIHNRITGKWDVVSYMPAPITDTFSIIPIKDDPGEYMDASGMIDVAVGYTKSPTINWFVHYNQVTIHAIN